MQLIDRVGRRPLLLISLAGMALSLGVLGAAFSLPQFKDVLGWVSICSLMAYVGSFAVGLGPVFWLILSEIYPLRIRGRAMSVGTAANWSANLLVALTFLTLTKVMGKPATFWLYGAVTVAAWFFAFFLVPETRGKTLEQIEAHMRSGKHPRGRCWRRIGSKPVSHAGLRNDRETMSGIACQFAAQIAHRDTQEVDGILILGAAPDLVNELAVRPHPASVAGHHGQKVIFGSRQSDLSAGDEYLSPIELHSQVPGYEGFALHVVEGAP
jgi:MFS family permease